MLACKYAELAYELAAFAEFLAKPSVEVPPDNEFAKSKDACASIVPVLACVYAELAYELAETEFTFAVLAAKKAALAYTPAEVAVTLAVLAKVNDALA